MTGAPHHILTHRHKRLHAPLHGFQAAVDRPWHFYQYLAEEAAIGAQLPLQHRLQGCQVLCRAIKQRPASLHCRNQLLQAEPQLVKQVVSMLPQRARGA
jgi:hypothetical protein